MLTTLDTDLGMMMKWLRDNVQSGRHTVFVEGEAIPTYKNWIRDHVHTMKAFRHWEYNLKAYLDFTLAYQRPDGSYYELIKQMDDPHWSFVAEDDVLFFPEDNLYLARLDIESDIEYLVVEGADATTVLLNGNPVEFRQVLVGDSRYVDFSARGLKGRANIEILF